MHRRLFITLLALTAATLAAASAPTPTPATQPALSDAALATLIQNLGNPDFATRESAQKSLEQTTVADLPRLLKLNEAQTDPEIKTRLASRIEPLQEQLALNPPGLTLHLKEAASGTVALELSNQLGVKISSMNFNPSRPGLAITLDADQKPFWDIMHDLALQNLAQISITSPDGGTSFFIVPRTADIHGPFAAFANSITTTKQLTPQASPDLPPPADRVTVGVTFALDPRVKIARASSPRILSLEDDLGNSLYQAAPNQHAALSDSSYRYPISLSTTANIPQKPGKTLTLKGETLLEVAVAQATTIIDNPDQHLNEPIIIGNRSITVTTFNIPPNPNGVINFSVKSTPYPDPGNGPVVPDNIATSQRVEVKIVDANGDSIWTTQITGSLSNFSNSVQARIHPAPYKFSATAPTRTKTILVPFELKNLPMPPP